MIMIRCFVRTRRLGNAFSSDVAGRPVTHQRAPSVGRLRVEYCSHGLRRTGRPWLLRAAILGLTLALCSSYLASPRLGVSRTWRENRAVLTQGATISVENGNAILWFGGSGLSFASRAEAVRTGASPADRTKPAVEVGLSRPGPVTWDSDPGEGIAFAGFRWDPKLNLYSGMAPRPGRPNTVPGNGGRFTIPSWLPWSAVLGMATCSLIYSRDHKPGARH